MKDAHERYANIEVAYLLQKTETYDGAVILASKLSRNIDRAFGGGLERARAGLTIVQPTIVQPAQSWGSGPAVRGVRASLVLLGRPRINSILDQAEGLTPIDQ